MEEGSFMCFFLSLPRGARPGRLRARVLFVTDSTFAAHDYPVYKEQEVDAALHPVPFEQYHIGADSRAVRDNVLAIVEGFHDQMAAKLPMADNLRGLRCGIAVDDFLSREQHKIEEAQKKAQKDLSEGVVQAVREEMREGFVEAKDPSISKGKGCTQKMKDHMDVSSRSAASSAARTAPPPRMVRRCASTPGHGLHRFLAGPGGNWAGKARRCIHSRICPRY